MVLLSPGRGKKREFAHCAEKREGWFESCHKIRRVCKKSGPDQPNDIRERFEGEREREEMQHFFSFSVAPGFFMRSMAAFPASDELRGDLKYSSCWNVKG